MVLKIIFKNPTMSKSTKSRLLRLMLCNFSQNPEVGTLIRKNKDINDADLKNFLKTHDSELNRSRPKAEEVILMFEKFCENNRIARILDY